MSVWRDMAYDAGARGDDLEQMARMVEEQEREQAERREADVEQDRHASALSDMQRTEQLKVGEACEFRFPARREWRPGRVEVNGGSYFWQILDDETGKSVQGLYIEHVRAPGTDPWGELL